MTKKEAEPQPQTKTFSLKQSDLNLLNSIQQRHQAVIVDILASIAVDRFGYQVTQNTTFKLTEKNELILGELPVEPVKEDSPVKAAS